MYFGDEDDELWSEEGEDEVWWRQARDQEDDDDDLDDMLDDESDTAVDMIELDLSVDRKIVLSQMSLLGMKFDDSSIGAGFVLEAELLLFNHDYRSALVCARAGARFIDSLAASAIEMICMYQLGDRKRAHELMNTIEARFNDKGHGVSEMLTRKFFSTCEVIQFMPQLLGLLKQQQKSPPRRL